MIWLTAARGEKTAQGGFFNKGKLKVNQAMAMAMYRDAAKGQCAKLVLCMHCARVLPARPAHRVDSSLVYLASAALFNACLGLLLRTFNQTAT